MKVLDFGLAKAMEPAPADAPNASQSPTITSPAMTHAGMILGTAAYMSPEQARGQAVDKRTDIWAFGCVLYEMLTGRPAFTGDSVSEVLASVLAREPDLCGIAGCSAAVDSPPDTTMPPEGLKPIGSGTSATRGSRFVDAGTGEQGMVAQPTRGRDRSRRAGGMDGRDRCSVGRLRRLAHA